MFEMSDDPFEVRLRDNYELLEDEYNESLKRQKMLDEKVCFIAKIYYCIIYSFNDKFIKHEVISDQ